MKNTIDPIDKEANQVDLPDQPIEIAESSAKMSMSVKVPAGETVRITIEVLPPEGNEPVSIIKALPKRLRREPLNIGASLKNAYTRLRGTQLSIGSHVLTLQEIIFVLVILVYLATRFIGITRFPIYFFTDEAIQTMQASDFIRDGLHNADKDLLPTYFTNGSQYNLSLSVYIQVIPYLIFGKSEEVTRGVAALATLVAALGIGFILKDIFKIKYWWLGTLILSITPAWFLHSRTAFETSLMASMYTGFLYFYLRYRYISPKSLYAALIFGALTFYAYSPGQVVIVVTGVLLLITDFPYHWRNRKTGLIGLGIIAVSALPYLRFMLTHGIENYNHLVTLNSYWVDPIPLIEKIKTYASYYAQGLNPFYWFIPNDSDLSRHLLKGYGHLLSLAFPFAVLGLGICLKNIRSSMHRLILIAVLASPTGAALVGIGITRVLVFVIPVTLLTTLGVIACLEWLEKRNFSEKLITFGVLIPLVAFNFYMLNDALVNGPLWYTDYGLGGMQWGANQVFPAAEAYLKQNPQTQIIISPSWANGTDVIARFYLGDKTSIQMGSIEGYFNVHQPLADNTLFIMIPQEYQEMQASKKFTDINVEKIMNCPDGTPCFYFVKLRYVDNIDAILQQEAQARTTLQTGQVTINGKQVTVHYSMLDMGDIQNAFDGDTNTLVRSLEANPLVIEVTFPTAQSMSGVSVQVGGVETKVSISLQVAGESNPVTFQNQVPETPMPKEDTIDFGSTLQVQTIHIEVLSVNDTVPAHIHVWEITFK